MSDPGVRKAVARWALIAGGLHLLLWGVLYFMALDMWGNAPVRDTFGGRADVFALTIGLWACSGIAAVVLFLAGLLCSRYR